jgi:hypothetical protein
LVTIPFRQSSVVREPEFFVSDETGTTGPLSAAAMRGVLRSRTSAEVKVRFAGTPHWLPASALDDADERGPPPAPPPAPRDGASMTLPKGIAELTPKMREYVLWFVADADGVMGPFTGEFVRRGILTGKIAPSASLCMVASQDWVRASIAIPTLNDKTTKARRAEPAGASCAFCREPMSDNDQACSVCGERVLHSGTGGRLWLAALVVLVFVALFGVGAVTMAVLRERVPWLRARLSRGLLNEPAGSPSGVLGQGPHIAASGSAASDQRRPSSSAPADTAPRTVGHLAGEPSGKIDVAPDAVFVLALAHHRIAVVRKTVVEVLDEKSGALAVAAADLPALHALVPVGDSVYGLGEGRIAIIDPESFRVRKWLALGSPLGALAAGGAVGSGPFAVVPLEAERAVSVIDIARHAEIERFHFDERVTSVSLDDKATVAVGATSDARGPRPGEDAVLVFDPSRTASAQLLRRVYVGAAPVAVAVAPSGALAAVARFSSAEIARVDLASSAARGAAPADALQKTCAEPILLRFAAASGLLLVGCQGGRAIAIHDAVSFAKITQIDLDGPVIGLDVAPDGLQALTVVGPPAASVGVIDLTQRSLQRLAIKDEIASARYDRTGTAATAFSLRAHRVWVIR